MLLVLSKVIPAFLFPAGLVVLLCLLAAWFAFRKGAKRAGLTALCAALLLYAAASPAVSNMLMLGLESGNPPVAVSPHAAAIVLLGGGMAPPTAPRMHPETNAAGDRVIHAARLWREGRAPFIVATGGFISFLTDAPGTEADLYARLLTEVFGLPDSAVVRMGRSRTTHEDALFTAGLFDSAGFEKEILLVTSASHMPRAVALFRKQGFVVHEAPTDFRGTDPSGFVFFSLLPSGAALAETTTALHEYLGMWAYKMLGRL
jgi:uncharacterized SAM-binding protein YcdF (DUF218 family)